MEAPPSIAYKTMLFSDCPDLMSIERFADCLGVSKQVAWKMAREELVPNVRIGRRIFIPRDLLSDFILEGVRG